MAGRGCAKHEGTNITGLAGCIWSGTCAEVWQERLGVDRIGLKEVSGRVCVRELIYQ